MDKENFPFDRPSFRQNLFAALCGVGTTVIVFALCPAFSDGLWRFLLWASPSLASALGTTSFFLYSERILKILGPIGLFLYLNKRQPTGPWCFFINYCSQLLILYLLRVPFKRINRIYDGFDLRYEFLSLVWPLTTVLVQWLVSLYVRKKKAEPGFSLCREIVNFIWGKRPLTTGAKIRRFLFTCILFLTLIRGGLYWVYFPWVFNNYLETLPNPETCRVEVAFDSVGKWELDETQRAELLERMKRMKYLTAYGPLSLSERTPPDIGYVIYIYPSNGEMLQPFALQTNSTFHSGFFCESPILPVGYWLNMGNWYDLHNWLTGLSVEDLIGAPA